MKGVGYKEPMTYEEQRREQIKQTSRDLDESFAQQRERSQQRQDELQSQVDGHFNTGKTP